jgi:hypothetical protein
MCRPLKHSVKRMHDFIDMYVSQSICDFAQVAYGGAPSKAIFYFPGVAEQSYYLTPLYRACAQSRTANWNTAHHSAPPVLQNGADRLRVAHS